MRAKDKQERAGQHGIRLLDFLTGCSDINLAVAKRTFRFKVSMYIEQVKRWSLGLEVCQWGCYRRAKYMVGAGCVKLLDIGFEVDILIKLVELRE